MKTSLAVVASIVVGIACQPLTQPTPIFGLRFPPPIEWNSDWAAMETCTGIHGNLSRLSWYRVADGGIGDRVMGRWDFPHRITLTEFVVTHNVADTRRHEMIHDLTQSGEHGPEFQHCGV